MHTPTFAGGDDRAARLLESAKVPDAKRERLLAVLGWVQAAADAAGKELQLEYGPTHIGLIAEHNQAVRLLRAGAHAGDAELFLETPQRAQLAAAGYALQEPELAVFKLFGWVRVDPSQGSEEGLRTAAQQALAKAIAMRKS